PVGIVDITLYRDDLTQVGQQPIVNNTEIPFPIAGKDVLIVDDVLYTGRTVRAAMDALFKLGRPARVQLLVLIDRGHRELPIEAQYTGRTVVTTPSQVVEVKFYETDGADKVVLAAREEARS
ncbi:MAG: bifunctional pyr operon transcriptional regulator/uracil phosphoribosyltransferase PyrR, partial [Bryobacterales bacterium]|nr:bifunctional pyr operon transcriptional regulator/uracil phosphoribosyltransferase PyrR [Bryobacterales bacterium]